MSAGDTPALMCSNNASSHYSGKHDGLDQTDGGAIAQRFEFAQEEKANMLKPIENPQTPEKNYFEPKEPF